MKSKLLLLCAMIVLLASCKSTYQQAYNGVYKAHKKNTAGARDASLAIWPLQTKDSVSIQYLPGDSVPIPGPVVYVNCDSLLAAQKANPNVKLPTAKVPVQCPESYLLRDTLKYFQQQVVEDMRKVDKAHDSIAALHRMLVAKDVAITTLSQDIKDKKRKNMRLWYVLSALSAYMVLRVVARFKFPFIYKFLP